MNMNAGRKISAHRKYSSRDAETRQFSQQSILSSIERYVEAIDEMNEVIMVPSRLMDMETDNNNIGIGTAAGDLYNFYTMLNAVKTQLIWGASGGADTGSNKSAVVPATPPPLVRRMSTVSAMSLSDSEAETESSCSESDSRLSELPQSGITTSAPAAEDEDPAAIVAANFRRHLCGLYRALEQLTDTAGVLTQKYQEEVSGDS